MKYIRNMKRPRLATIMAGLALFIVLGGSAAAAGGLINGKKIKRGTITAKQIKNKTITKGKIAPSAISALAGAQGPKGDQGAKGAQGAQGAKGAPGAQGIPGTPDVDTYFTRTSSANNIPANTDAQVAILNGLAASRYVITVNVQVFTSGAGLVTCGLTTSGGGGTASGAWTAPANGRNVISMARSTSAPINQATVTCKSTGANSAYTADVTAIDVN